MSQTHITLRIDKLVDKIEIHNQNGISPALIQTIKNQLLSAVTDALAEATPNEKRNPFSPECCRTAPAKDSQVNLHKPSPHNAYETVLSLANRLRAASASLDKATARIAKTGKPDPRQSRGGPKDPLSLALHNSSTLQSLLFDHLMPLLERIEHTQKQDNP
jgi:hypothetical protein